MNIFNKLFRSLHILSGEDYEIIRKLNVKEINYSFNWIGFCVLIISISCLVSATNFIFHVMEGAHRFLSIPIGVFWGFTVTTIYILLLYTITPPLLIDKSILKSKQKNSTKKAFVLAKEYLTKIDEWLSFSMILRIGFILIFALIIAQPLNVILFSKLIEKDIDNYRIEFKSKLILETDKSNILHEFEVLKDFEHKVSLKLINDTLNKEMKELITEKIISDQNFLNDTKKINTNIERLKVSQNNIHEVLLNRINLQLESDSVFIDKVSELENKSIISGNFQPYLKEIKEIILEKNNAHKQISKVIDDNDFYLRQIIFLNQKSSFAWLNNLLFCGIFIIPIYLKYNVRKITPKKQKAFYEYKKQIEEELVKRDYDHFKRQFSENLENFNRKSMENIFRNIEPLLAQLEKIKPEKAEKIKSQIFERMNRNFEFYEIYEDAPFNLKKKETTKKTGVVADIINDCHNNG